MNKLIIVTLGIAVCSLAFAQTSKKEVRYDSTKYTKIVRSDDIVTQRLSFESEKDLSITSKSEYSLSNKRYKDGSKSLLWSWDTPSELIFEKIEGLPDAVAPYPGGQPEKYEPSYVSESRQGGMKLWVYREIPHETGKITFSVGESSSQATSTPCYRFEMKQNFSGWRALWVHFEEDAKYRNCSNTKSITTLVVKPSDDLVDDKVHIDLMQFLSFISHKRHSDLQFSNRKSEKKPDQYKILPAWNKNSYFRSQASKINLSDIEEDLIDRDFALIEKRYENLLVGPKNINFDDIHQGQEFLNFWTKKVKTANNYLNQLNIEVKNGSITGTPLFSSRDEHPGENRRTFQLASQNSFSILALDYRINPTPQKKQEIVKALDFFQDQGWASGSSIGTVDHLIRVNPYGNTVFLMRHALRDVNKLESHRKALEWYTRFGDLVDIDTTVGENSDLIRGGLIPKLLSILMLEDTSEKLVRMQAFLNYVNHVSATAPGYMDTIKPDYTIFHHLAAYQNTYGIQGVTTVSIVDWLLKGTQFELPKKTREHIKKTLIAQTNIAADFELHPALAGRFPYRNSGIDRYLLPAYAFMAMEDNKIVDEELGSLFSWIYKQSDLGLLHDSLVPTLNYYGSFGTLSLLETAWHQTKSYEWKPSTGHFTFPYAAASVHKRQNWAAAVRGWSQYVWDWESGTNLENPYGRYMAFGGLLLFTKGSPLSLEDSGIDLDGGFHWSYIPGATTKELPMEDMGYLISPAPNYPEGRHRNYTFETFVGGVSHKQENGVFAMRMKDTVTADERGLFDDTFSADKSYFFFGNEVIALGSGINNEDAKHSTITTLFQSKLDKGSKGAKHNGSHLNISDNARFSSHNGWISDPQGNYYVVHEGKWTLDQANQSSLVPRPQIASKGKASEIQVPISARHVKAWLDHGKSPTDGSYEYQILLQSSEDIAYKRSKGRNYIVHSKDENAHILEHLSLGQTGYAIFKPNLDLPGDIQSVDTPLLMMTHKSGDELNISVADPDLRLAKHGHNMSFMPIKKRKVVSASKVSNISIRGHWKIIGQPLDIESISYTNGSTQIRLSLNHGLTRELKFVRKK